MTNHLTGSTATEEIYGFIPVPAHFSADDVTGEQDHPISAWQKADIREHRFPHQNISGYPFVRRFGLDGAIERTITNATLWTTESTGRKIFLPRRPGGQRFGPQQYYYAASKSGVVPSWAISAAAHPA